MCLAYAISQSRSIYSWSDAIWNRSAKTKRGVPVSFIFSKPGKVVGMCVLSIQELLSLGTSGKIEGCLWLDATVVISPVCLTAVCRSEPLWDWFSEMSELLHCKLAPVCTGVRAFGNVTAVCPGYLCIQSKQSVEELKWTSRKVARRINSQNRWITPTNYVIMKAQENWSW